MDGAFNSSVSNCEPRSEMMKYVTSFLATSKKYLISISRRLHQSFLHFFFVAPVIRISDDDHLPRKCFAHIRHSLLDLESLTFEFERLDVEIFIVLTLSYLYNHDLRSCDYLCILSITRPDAASGRLVNREPISF